MTGALLITGRIKGVHRPALCPILPSETGKFLMIDCGANTIWVTPYLDYWLEDYIENGEYEKDDFYEIDKVSTSPDKIKTSQGNAELYIREWSMSGDLTFKDYYVVLRVDDELAVFSISETYLENIDMTIEQFAKAMYNVD
jgi:hypothetical protein